MKKAPLWAFLLHFELSFNIKLARFIFSSEIKELKCTLIANKQVSDKTLTWIKAKTLCY